MTAWLAQWHRRSPRERRRFVLIGLVWLGVVGYVAWYRPQSVRLAKARRELATLQQQAAAMNAALPDVDRERRQLRQQTDQTAQFHDEMQGVEQQLPTEGQLGQLVGELTKRAEGLSITFESIKQHVSDDAERPDVTVDVACAASYQAVVNYLRRVEQLSPFLRVTRLEVAEPKDTTKTTPVAHVTLSMPLRAGDEGGPAWAVPPSSSGSSLTMPRDPFGTPPRPAGAGLQGTVKVMGITWRGPQSTAILNNEVVRVGDHVDRLVVTQILHDKVVLSDGTQSYTIPLEQ